MLSVSPAEAERALVDWVRGWLDLLAAGRLADACALLDEPNAYGKRWRPADLTELVADTFGPGTRFRARHPEGPVFTPLAAARGDGHATVSAFDDGSGYWVEHDVPLNGEYSDLTAQFEFRWRGGALAAALHDLHVL